MVNLETARLIVRDFRIEDAVSLAKHINHPLIAHLTANIPHPYSLEMAQKYIEENILGYAAVPRTNYQLAIENKENREVIGSIGLLKVDLKNSKSEIGYWLGVDYHRMGIMSEAEKAILDFGFDELKLHKIHGTALGINEGSNGLFKKFGFRQVGIFKEDRLKDGERIDAVLWELLNRDYQR
jgi:ribosomal-protein-alanine N-acetyltransferase